MMTGNIFQRYYLLQLSVKAEETGITNTIFLRQFWFCIRAISIGDKRISKPEKEPSHKPKNPGYLGSQDFFGTMTVLIQVCGNAERL